MNYQTQGLSIYAEVQGTAEPALVFLHYWGGTSRTWRKVTARPAMQMADWRDSRNAECNTDPQRLDFRRPENLPFERTTHRRNYNRRGNEEYIMDNELAAPPIVDRSTLHAELDALRVREKAHTKEGDAIAAARRRLPMVEVPASTPLMGEHGPVTLLDAFEGRRLLIAYYFMWHTGKPAPEQCEGCTWVTSNLRELSYIHARDASYAVFCQGPYAESRRYRDFMGWDMPWYSALGSLETLLTGRRVGRMHLVCYLRQESKVFETYWTTSRGVEYMDNSYRLLDLTVYGRQERFEDSPDGWPQPPQGTDTMRADGRPLAQWPRLKAGFSDDLGAGTR